MQYLVEQFFFLNLNTICVCSNEKQPKDLVFYFFRAVEAGLMQH